jgi:hypothetical protein
MSILGGNTTITGRLKRAKNNALTVTLQTDGGDLGEARQKGSAGVLFGFKNGGRGTYKLTAGQDVLDLDVGPTTTVTRNGAPLGRISGHGDGARFEDAAGRVLALLRPHQGPKAEDVWRHPITSPDGAELGTLSLVRVNTAWKTLSDVITTWAAWDVNTNSLKMPSAGSLLALIAPLDSTLDALVAAACVDVAVFPRGYVASNSTAS